MSGSGGSTQHSANVYLVVGADKRYRSKSRRTDYLAPNHILVGSARVNVTRYCRSVRVRYADCCIERPKIGARIIGKEYRDLITIIVLVQQSKDVDCSLNWSG